jgi:hypothetical protein
LIDLICCFARSDMRCVRFLSVRQRKLAPITVAKQSRAERFLIPFIVAACALSLGMIVVSRRRGSADLAERLAGENAEEASLQARSRPRAAAIVLAARSAESVAVEDRSRREDADRLLEPVLRLASSREGSGLEAMVNQADGYLRGMVEAARVLDPRAIAALREKFQEGVCTGAMTADRELVLYARLMAIDSGIGTPRGIECAFKAHPQEDIVLWMLLDSWNALGRPVMAGWADLERNATDIRTRERLLSAETRVQNALEFRTVIQSRSRPHRGGQSAQRGDEGP